MLPQVIICAIGDAFKLLPVATAEWKFIFDIDAGLGIVGQLIGIVLAESQVLFL